MADLTAVAAWRSLAEERAGVEPAPDLDPTHEAATRRAAARAALIGKGDAWTQQAVAYERAMTATPPKPDPTEKTKRWQAARYGGLAEGNR